MNYSFLMGLNKYTFPYCIFSKIPASTSAVSSLVVCLVLNPICSAKQIAGRYGLFLQLLYAFNASFSVNRFSCATKSPSKLMWKLYIILMNRASRYMEHVLSNLMRASKSIKYICKKYSVCIEVI